MQFSLYEYSNFFYFRQQRKTSTFQKKSTDVADLLELKIQESQETQTLHLLSLTLVHFHPFSPFTTE